MARGPKKHLKRVFAPKKWMLEKLNGVWAPRPSCGPHKLRECLPIIILLRNKLKYALNYTEAKLICAQKGIRVDSKVRTDVKYPVGFMDVVSIEKTNTHLRILYDTKGRFTTTPISEEESAMKLCRIKATRIGNRGVVFGTTHDGRSIPYLDPAAKTADSILLTIKDGTVSAVLKCEVGALVMVTGGRNIGRVGVIQSREPHPGSFEIVTVRDSKDHTFATRITNVFVIGDSNPYITLPKGDGIKKDIMEEREERINRKMRV